jgi:oxygen-independent coproporphyrinogen-3 oxidase
MIGLGVASFSHVGGSHFQNEHDWGPYLKKIGEGQLPIHRALTPTVEECMIRELILQMKLGTVDIPYFQDKFGVDIKNRFAGPFGHLKEQGFLSVDGNAMRLSRDGLLQVDWLLHDFFLPKHK